MVRFLRVFRHYNGNTFVILGCLLVIVAVHFTIKIIERNYSLHSSCVYDEPIDIVYTWVNGSDPLFISQMNKYMKYKKQSVDSSKQRFDDKHELRFSLRSLEKFAPWINHIYVVTNGQIPYWLNLDCDKISIITHNMIFKDQNNLPTFSSPAIESNLHRIPGLSDKFIYFNDDIFLGQPLYLDDFYSVNKGYLIYLAYTLPNCANNCPWLYVGDGQCDVSCNTKKCQFDGGDCSKKANDQILYVEDVNFQSITESHNEKINRELEMLKQKVKMFFEHNQRNSILNNNINVSNLLQGGKIVYNNTNELLLVNKKQLLSKTYNLSISELVEEHNQKVIVQNKKKNRKRRFLLKGQHSDHVLATYIQSSTNNIDGFLESLLYTQRLFNKKYGFKPRYVPAHAPIFLEKSSLTQLESTFPTEFEITERNRFRHDDDVQFGFSYYYYLMSEVVERSIEAVFDEFDTDQSQTWSDREIRNLLTRIYDLPLSYEIVDHFEDVLLNCSTLKKFPNVQNTPPYERYIDSRLPTISKKMVVGCSFLNEFLMKRFGQVPKYKHEIIKNAENVYATFRMLRSNITNVVIKLDEIRSKLTKFVCLNDNLDESKPAENDLVRAILYDFYLSLFPHPSQYELPEHSRNRFLYVAELNEWKRRHFLTKIVLCLAIISLILITFFNVLKKGCCKVFYQLLFC